MRKRGGIESANQALAILDRTADELNMASFGVTEGLESPLRNLKAVRTFVSTNLPPLSRELMDSKFGFYSSGHIVEQLVRYSYLMAKQGCYGASIPPLDEAQKILLRPENPAIYPFSGVNRPETMPYLLEVPTKWWVEDPQAPQFANSLHAFTERRDQGRVIDFNDLADIKKMAESIKNCYTGPMKGDRVEHAPYAKNIIDHLLRSLWMECKDKQGTRVGLYTPTTTRTLLLWGVALYNTDVQLQQAGSSNEIYGQPLLVPLPEVLQAPLVLRDNLKHLSDYKDRNNQRTS